MAVKIKNSLNTFLDQSLILEQNSLETVSKLNKAVTSDEETVTLTLVNPKDPEDVKSYQIPSFGYLKACIDRLDTTVNSLTNLSGKGNSKIRLSDGTYRQIMISSIPSEAPNVSKVGKITEFKIKTNWFFENMLNPYLYVDIDLTDQVSTETDKVIVRRYILQCDTVDKRNEFDNKFKGKNDIDFKDFVNTVVKKKIKHTSSEEVRDIPSQSKRYSGTFTVTESHAPETDYNGKTTKSYTLSTLEYSDGRSVAKNTKILTAGDYLEVVTDPITTRYKVSYVDVTKNQVQLQLAEGGVGLTLGSNLKISSEQDVKTIVDVPVGHDQREVIFVKPIDPNSNIPANDWSPGIGFYSNELTFTDRNNDTWTLQKYYQQKVIDFGQVILSYAKDYYPSIREGIIPNAPILFKDNFKVVKINEQLTEFVDMDEFRNLVQQKNLVSSQIGEKNQAVSEQRTYLQTTDFVTTGDKTEAYNKLQTLIKEQNVLVSNYNSIVQTIKARTTDQGYDSTPKYRVRGFWEIPQSQISDKSGEQKIVKFKIRYRYRSKNGNIPDETTINVVTTSNSIVRGKISNWNEISTSTRKRVLSSTGEYVWDSVDIADPYEIKMNQCDIAINPGEQLEIQVKSISEAGWPANPMESDWSNSVIISYSDFPELETENLDEVISQNRIDAAVAGLGIYNRSYSEHMDSSFYTGSKYYAHTADVITSGFLTADQTPISLYDKLQELHSKISQVVDRVEQVTGNVVVNLIDEDNNIYNLNEGSTTYIYAGDYVSEVEKLSNEEKKGAIITKTFQIEIKSDNETGLYLFSKIWGNRLSMCPDSKTYLYMPKEEEEKMLPVPDTMDFGDSDSDSDSDSESEEPKVTGDGGKTHRQKSASQQVQVSNGATLSYVNPIKTGTTKQPLYFQYLDKTANLSPEILINNFQKIYTLDTVRTVDITPTQNIDDKYISYSSQGWNDTMNSNSKYVTTDTSTKIKTGIDKDIMYIDYKLYKLMNRYDLYENSINIKKVYSDYYNNYGRYDLVPINLTNSDYIDYQIASPNMYQSAQCHGQFIYSRFTNIAGTFNMYANMINTKGYAAYDDLQPFSLSECVYGLTKSEPIWKEMYTPKTYKTTSLQKKAVVNDLSKMVGEEIGANVNDTTLYQNAGLIMNRLPVTYNLQENALSEYTANRKTPTLNLSQNLRYTELLANRVQVSDTLIKNSSSYDITPKVQATYGFGNISDQLKRVKTTDENVYLTTHKIGYEYKDRYATGAKTCNSYLFLSPDSHKSIQVDGDSKSSTVYVSSSKSIRVPLVYQYRMKDYTGSIFGNRTLKSYNATVINTKYANIIGLDIWADVLSDTPKQYDIIVYSTYGGLPQKITDKAVTNTQQIANAMVTLSKNADTLLKNAQSVTMTQTKITK